jgi:hypothetical protein
MPVRKAARGLADEKPREDLGRISPQGVTNSAIQATKVPTAPNTAAWPKTGSWPRLATHRQPISPIGIAAREQRMLTTPRVAEASALIASVS